MTSVVQPHTDWENASHKAGASSRYRHSEVGDIPVDWAVDSLSSTLLSPPRYGIGAAAVAYDDSLPAYIRITDIDEQSRFRPSPRVSVAHPEATRFFLGPGDLVFARTGASVGKSYLYDWRDGPLVYAGFLIRVAPDPRRLLPNFLAYYVQSRRYWDWVNSSSVRSGQPGINAQQYGKLRLPLPSLAEQHAIAEALSDADELLSTLDTLIAKKQAVKQAAMQQLLTGRTRLPGFSAPWETRSFHEVLQRANTKAHQILSSEYRKSGSYPVVDQGQEAVAGYSDNESRVFRCPDGGVIVFGDHTCIAKFVDFDFVVGADGTQVILAKGQHITQFFAYHLQHNSVEPTGYNRHFKFLRAREFLVPQTAEQIAIASCLSDMDAEIAALEARRNKTRAIKLGMMQQLLTGRIRLVDPAEVSEASA